MTCADLLLTFSLVSRISGAVQTDLDNWLWHYNNERIHQGKMCCGRTPMETLLDGKRVWAEKNLNQI
jgi:hypothetical protein